jgi:hypothetical protein
VKRSTGLKRGAPLTRKKGLRAKPGGSAFPKRRNPAYRQWVQDRHPCILWGQVIGAQFSVYDMADSWDSIRHNCWGPVDPAHVWKHQATGANDVGCILPMCRASHQAYDERRAWWHQVTGISAEQLEVLARELGTRWETGR